MGLYRVVFGLLPFSKPEMILFSLETAIIFTLDWEKYIYSNRARYAQKTSIHRKPEVLSL